MLLHSRPIPICLSSVWLLRCVLTDRPVVCLLKYSCFFFWRTQFGSPLSSSYQSITIIGSNPWYRSILNGIMGFSFELVPLSSPNLTLAPQTSLGARIGIIICHWKKLYMTKSDWATVMALYVAREYLIWTEISDIPAKVKATAKIIKKGITRRKRRESVKAGPSFAASLCKSISVSVIVI